MAQTTAKRLTATQLFIDGGDPAETAQAVSLLRQAGFAGLDGQTTNPSLVAQNPAMAARIKSGGKLSLTELLDAYREIVEEIERLAAGAISIEVYADTSTPAADMVQQARAFAQWIDSVVIKLPIIPAGLEAAALLKNELKLNMTLCFSQEQVAAVYAATRGSAYPVFISPFIGRLDDRGENGMDLVTHSMRMLEAGDGHVHVLAASLRTLDHVLGVLSLGVQAMTLPFKTVFVPWAKAGFTLPDETYSYVFEGSPIPYQELDLKAEWQSFDVRHSLTDAGLQKFADDWNGLLV